MTSIISCPPVQTGTPNLIKHQDAVEKGVPLLTHGSGANILLLRQVQALAVQIVVDYCFSGVAWVVGVGWRWWVRFIK